MERVGTSAGEKVFAFTRSRGEDVILVVSNLTGEGLTVALDSDGITGDYTDVFTGNLYSLQQENDMEMAPWGYRLLLLRN